MRPLRFHVLRHHGHGDHLVASAWIDGASCVTPGFAQGKAWTSAAFGSASDVQKQRMASMPNFAQALTTTTASRYAPQNRR